MANPAKATRQSFGEALARLGAENQKIVVLDADLSKSTKSDLFAKKFPERFFEMGIQEANMIGAASGLAFTGKLPFLCSFGAFLTGRYDTVRLSAVYSGANIRMVGTHAGLGIGDDGHSQMGLEDIALMRVLPTMGVFQPMDDAETQAIMDYLVRDYVGPAYLRLTRQHLPDYSSSAKPFVPGRPMDASVTMRNAATRRGITFFSPPNSLMRRVCRRSESMPTIRNSPPVLTPWFSIW